MSEQICVVCKQKIDKSEHGVVSVPEGLVHGGTCKQFYDERALTENKDDLCDVVLL